MRYFTINISDFSIVEVFSSLKELRNHYPDLEVVDYIDDLDEVFESMYLISEGFIASLIKNSKDGESSSNLRDIISLKEDMDELKERYNQASIEIDTVHSEYVKVFKENENNEKTIAEKKEEISKLNVQKNELQNEINQLVDENKKERASSKKHVDNLTNVLASNYLDEIQDKMTDVVRKIMEMENEIEQYERGETF